MPDDLTPASRARLALAQAQGDTEYGKGIPQERVRVELDEGALLSAVELQIEAAVLEERQRLHGGERLARVDEAISAVDVALYEEQTPALLESRRSLRALRAEIAGESE